MSTGFPYWMYSLEELRCDLTAFGEAVRLEGEGLAIARHVQYAILFDWLFRFPVSGTRVRNYDGLGGQLLFAYLHRHGLVHWTDNRLTSSGTGWPTASSRSAARSRSSTARASTARSSPTSAPRTTWWRAPSRRPPARRGRAKVVIRSRPRTCARTSTASCPTSSRSRSSAAGGLGPFVARRFAQDGATPGLGGRSLDRFGRVDALLHLVGGWRGGSPIDEAPLADAEALHASLVRTLQHTSRAFRAPLIASGRGRFAMIGAKAAVQPTSANAAYAAAKAAAEAWTFALADSFTDADDIAAALAYLCSDTARTMNGRRVILHP